MKYLISLFFSILVSGAAVAAPMHYTGDIHGSGNYSGNLDINFGWIDPPFGLNAWGDHVDLWQINGSAGDTLSLLLTSSGLSLGFSLYYGEISATDLLLGLFDNDGDVGSASYLVGASAWDSLQTLSDFMLAQSGAYTLVVGGKDFAGYTGYGYQLQVTHTQVPESSSLMLLIIGVLAVAGLRVGRASSIFQIN